jgi:hypothetical protein
MNDEEVDKAEEIEIDETVTLRKIGEVKELTKGEPKPISAVDTSSARLGETDKGILSAVKVALVIYELGKEPVYETFGPYVLHLTEENKHSVYNFFRTEIFNLDTSDAPHLIKMTDRVRNFLERIAQQVAASAIKDGITLWDGSLTGGTIDTPKEMLMKAIRIAHENGNGVVAVSKKSCLQTVDGRRLIDLLENETKPCYIDIHNWIDAQLDRFLGRVHAVKFSPEGFTFRVDVSSSANAVLVLNSLTSSCAFYNGYPEPLRQAHIHSYFTPNEILALQAYVADKYGLNIVRTFDVRRHLLAPYG